MIKNRKLSFEYNIFVKWNAGISLLGSEVKSLRRGSGSIQNAYAILENGEVFLINMDIPVYQFSSDKHSPKRKRKLLLKRKEINKLIRSKDEGMTLIPEQMYFSDRGYAKVILALCSGKKQFDKRKTIKERDAARQLARLKTG